MSANPTAEIREFRKAARLIIAAPKPRGKRLAALIRLGGRARQSEAGVLAQQAIWVEAKGFIRREPPLQPVSLEHPVDRAIRGLRRRGLERCPTCHRGIPTEEEIGRDQQRRADEVERRRLYEEAGQ